MSEFLDLDRFEKTVERMQSLKGYRDYLVDCRLAIDELRSLRNDMARGIACRAELADLKRLALAAVGRNLPNGGYDRMGGPYAMEALREWLERNP